jgi:hypothetical protein
MTPVVEGNELHGADDADAGVIHHASESVISGPYPNLFRDRADRVDVRYVERDRAKSYGRTEPGLRE